MRRVTNQSRKPIVAARSRMIATLSGILALLMVALGPMVPASAADAAYDAAVKQYNARNYRQAEAQFSQLRSAYPTNAMVHYYLALSSQGAGHFGQAKREFEWLVANDQGQLRMAAQKALEQLGGGSAAGDTRASGSSSSAGSSSSKSGPAKVKTIIDFYTSTDPQSKKLDPIFEIVRTKYPDIVFKKLDALNPANAELVKLYQVDSYPRLVYLDATGKVLLNNRRFPGSVGNFELAIRQFR